MENSADSIPVKICEEAPSSSEAAESDPECETCDPPYLFLHKLKNPVTDDEKRISEQLHMKEEARRRGGPTTLKVKDVQERDEKPPKKPKPIDRNKVLIKTCEQSAQDMETPQLFDCGNSCNPPFIFLHKLKNPITDSDPGMDTDQTSINVKSVDKEDAPTICAERIKNILQPTKPSKPTKKADSIPLQPCVKGGKSDAASDKGQQPGHFPLNCEECEQPYIFLHRLKNPITDDENRYSIPEEPEEVQTDSDDETTMSVKDVEEKNKGPSICIERIKNFQRPKKP